MTQATPGQEPSGQPEDRTSRRPTVLAYVLGGIALAGLLALGVPYLASGLLAPGWAVAVFCGLWVVMVVLGVVWIRRHPWRVVVLPIVALAVLYGGLTAGEAFLGWTA